MIKTTRKTTRKVRKYGAILFLLVGVMMMGKGIWVGSKAVVAQVLLDRAWETALDTGTPPAPWSWMDTKPMAKITVVSLGREAVILEGTSGQALAFGPAHMSGTPLPGQPGTSVIAAHKNTHFDFLKHLKTGDSFEIQLSSGEIQTYKITGAEIVHYKHSGITTVSAANAPVRVALVTCYPFDRLSYGGPLRYVVYAQLSTKPTRASIT